MRGEDRAGVRVAEVRKVRGWTQRELANRAHVSYSLLTKVEQGHVPATPAFIGAVARALRVDVPRITGQPYDEVGRSRGARLTAAIGPIRRSLATFHLPREDIAARPIHDLRASVTHISDLGRIANYTAIGETLPTLLDELSIAIHMARETDRPALYSLLGEAYSGASTIANLVGYLDLRDRVVDHIAEAARLGDDPLREVRVQWQRSAGLMANAAYDPALTLMERSRRDLGEDIARMDAPTLSMYGSLHLRSAILAARAGAPSRTNGDVVSREARAHQAWTHIEAARDVAARLDGDRDDYGLAFGPSNVAQHEVAVAVELEEGTEAIKRARRARVAATVPAVRRGHHYIDLARAHLMHGDHQGTLRCLQTARRIAPQQTQYHPMVRETVRGLAHASRATEDLSRFAGWLGLDL